MRILKSGGNVCAIPASRSLTRSTTLTVLVPDCFRTNRDTALSPFNREIVRGSSVPSVTIPTSRIRMGDPPLLAATMIAPKSSAVWTRAIVRRTFSLSP